MPGHDDRDSTDEFADFETPDETNETEDWDDPDRSEQEPEIADPDAPLNVLGGVLSVCGRQPMTGFFRDGCCATGPSDIGSHTVCAVLTDAFLSFTASHGNDLSSPRPGFNFPGLRAGDRWCLCVSRWAEALRAGVAPPVVLEATHEGALKRVTLSDLRAHAVRRA